jgi:hypothetical protein
VTAEVVDVACSILLDVLAETLPTGTQQRSA